jgi:hypothetical protein
MPFHCLTLFSKKVDINFINFNSSGRPAIAIYGIPVQLIDKKGNLAMNCKRLSIAK